MGSALSGKDCARDIALSPSNSGVAGSGSGSGRVETLVQQVVYFHSQPGDTLHCDC